MSTSASSGQARSAEVIADGHHRDDLQRTVAKVRRAGVVTELADAVVMSTSVRRWAHSNLLKEFLDLLPPNSLRGKVVLPLAIADNTAHLLAADRTLRATLTKLGGDHITEAWLMLRAQMRLYEDGGLLLEPTASASLREITDAFLRTLDGVPARTPTTAPRVDGVTAVRVGPDDPTAAPLLAELVIEYGTRYGRSSPRCPAGRRAAGRFPHRERWRVRSAHARR